MRITSTSSFTETPWAMAAPFIEQALIANRRYLHQHPELSFHEAGTAMYVRNQLISYGLTDIQEKVGNGYGLVARIHGEHEGPTIALRADMDALPIEEDNNLPFKSQNPGVMHACGHDGHTAMLLAVAQVMAKQTAHLYGTIVLIFQNAEETQPGGAKSMIEAGALEGVDRIYGLHVSPEHEAGVVGYALDYGSAASDTFKIQLQGRGGHGAKPHQSIDAVVMAAQLIADLQSIVSRNVDPVESAVLSFATVAAGGGIAPNVIADSAVIKGTVRTFNPSIRALVKRKLMLMAEHVGLMHEADVTVDYHDGYPALRNTTEIVEQAVKLLTASGRFKAVVDVNADQGPAMTGEDFAYYLQEVPGAFLNVGVMTDRAYPLHHPKFIMDEAGLIKGVEVLLELLWYELAGGKE